MQRLIRLSFLVAMIAALGFGSMHAQKPQVQVSGKIEPGQVRIFLKDSLYIINKSLVVGGTLIIEPGTEVLFHPNGRLIDSTGGRIIADGNAEAIYEANPVQDANGIGLNPIAQAGSAANLNGLAGYSDLAYFLNNRTSVSDPTARNADASAIDVTGTEVEPTVHSSKHGRIFWVVLDTVNRNVVNLVIDNNGDQKYVDANGDLQDLLVNQHVVVTYQEALIFIASRMNVDPSTDVNLKNLPYKRFGNKDPDVEQATIKFIGQPVNNFSREWGHIVILPGARAAFFRNVEFEGFKKDTTVDNDVYYNNVGSYNWATVNSNPDWDEINNNLRKLNNGSGGAITTYSSRTWLIGCTFRDNEARFKGGALQVLEAPAGYPAYYRNTNELINGTDAEGRILNGQPGYRAGIGSYPLDKNPNITDPDGSASSVNSNKPVPAIDLIDEPEATSPEPLTNIERAAHDDARLAIFLGRFRNNTFDDNRTLLADVRVERIGNQLVLIDADSASYPYGANSDYGNGTWGGALYISGATNVSLNEGGENRRLEICLGVNHSINSDLNGNGTYEANELITFDDQDSFVATNNISVNRQYDGRTDGTKGGALYVGRYTSVILSGYYNNNLASAPHFTDLASGFTPGAFSQGGAVYHENTLGRMQIRGGAERDNNSNATEFSDNTAGSGGAVYVNGNTDVSLSPIIGGMNNTLNTRNYGYNILFTNNTALTHGGAVYTKRNTWVNGAGGVEAGQLLGYGGKYPVRFWNNYANISGGGIHIDIPNANPLPAFQRNVQIHKSSFRENSVGTNVTGDNRSDIRGGGAIYTINGDLNVVQATEFIDNVVYNANGGAIAQVNPLTSSNRLFVTDLDVINYDANGVATGYTSTNDVFTWGDGVTYPADVRMLTRFINNEIILDQDILDSESGRGTTQQEGSVTDVVRTHRGTTLPENGVGLGGALYILDDVSVDRANRVDTVQFNRVRMQNNTSYTGAAVYSDNYNLKLIFNRSLVTGNTANSGVGASQNLITGPIIRNTDGSIDINHASSDLAGAVIYGEVQGPIPSNLFSEAANSIYDNNARFLIRLPDAPDTKGLLAGTSGIGFGGTDTLRGNYWGRTEANINLELENLKINNTQYDFANVNPETFFVAGDGNTWLRFRNQWTAGDDPREQGPFESIEKGYTYEPIPLLNVDGDQNTAADNSIPENLLMSGHIYDIYDKGTDIKTADYSKRRMSPIEDFAVGIPPMIENFDNPGLPSDGKYVRRWVRDPFCVEDDNYSTFFSSLQSEYKPDEDGNFYHPIGQPLYLEAMVDYDGLVERSNHDPLVTNETVFFVINETTSDFIRVNLTQVSEDGSNWETFRSRVEFVPDSSNRVPNSLLRRSAEGLANFGVGQPLLDRLADNPYNEDASILPGRKYSNRSDLLGGAGDLFSNRPSLPDDNDQGANYIATYFAGERYGALPVNVGDDIRIVSRTVLWDEGTVPAFDKGISFKISNGIEEPKFTGDIVRLQTDTITIIRPSEVTPDNQAGIPDTLQMVELVNTVFVSEDRTYPVANGVYSNLTGDEQGRDSILAITAVDSNNYYDPRAIISATEDDFTYLTYWWDVQDNSGLENWLLVDTVYAGNNNNQNPKDGAQGYFVFKGQPVNPYVVPGGEEVEVRAYSYPPHYRLLDSLKVTYGWENGNDTLAKFIELYPDYFHAQSYDNDNARFLQQDTIDVGGTSETYRNDYSFKIFVVDSIPSFIDWESDPEVLTRTDSDGNLIDTIVVYEGSMRACDPTDDGELVANLSGDKLRFQIDINTDDELEDLWAQRVHGWDFRYGRTAYGFVSTHISAGDTVRIDTTIYTDDNGDQTIDITQIRPSWLADEYLYEYDSDDTPDTFVEDFTVNGQLNVRIPKAEALSLLTPPVQFNNTLNLDTTMSVIVNDGHGGKRRLNYDIYINVAPEITTDNLEDAKEDIRYNPQLLDTNRRINVFDANFNDSHVFELIKEDDQRTEIPKDPCFPEAGNWELGVDYFNNTPEWLNINSTSGILYGTPGVEDAPRSDTVSVLVTDENGLTAVRFYILETDSTNHNPEITGVPSAECWDLGQPYSDTLTISDIDLDRIFEEEVLTVRVIEPNDGSITVEPSIINGFDEDQTEVQVVVTSGSLNIPLGPDDKGTITIEVTDAAGNVVTRTYKIKVSEPVDFVCELTIENNIGSFEVLEWGISHVGTLPTTGDGRDGADIGTLDKAYCEFELAPLPPSDVFDARWTLPSTNGVLRTIYPAGSDNFPEQFLYKAIIQPGGENGNSNIMYPITVTWDRTCIPDLDDTGANIDGSTWYIRDGFSNGDFFDINMRTGEGRGLEDWEINGDVVTLTLTNTVINSLVILADINSDVEDLTSEFGTVISNVTPNPISDDTRIEFTLANNSEVMIEVIDNLGNVVTTIENRLYTAGSYSVNWDGTTQTGESLSAGAYNVRLVAGGKIATYPIMLVK